MNDTTIGLDQTEEEILTYEVSDEAPGALLHLQCHCLWRAFLQGATHNQFGLTFPGTPDHRLRAMRAPGKPLTSRPAPS